jgi:TM2 domain-containing membrane protein YozV
MKGFATITLIISVIGSILGVLEMALGNGGEGLQGTLVLGGGFTGILLSLLVIAAVDIRDSLMRLELERRLP